jgi:hypothetical protein
MLPFYGASEIFYPDIVLTPTPSVHKDIDDHIQLHKSMFVFPFIFFLAASP